MGEVAWGEGCASAEHPPWPLHQGLYPGGLSSVTFPRQPFLVVEKLPSPTCLLRGPLCSVMSTPCPTG